MPQNPMTSLSFQLIYCSTFSPNGRVAPSCTPNPHFDAPTRPNREKLQIIAPMRQRDRASPNPTAGGSFQTI